MQGELGQNAKLQADCGVPDFELGIARDCIDRGFEGREYQKSDESNV